MIGLEYISKIFGLKFSDIARICGISRQSVNDWIKGRANIPQKHIKILSEHFKLPKVYFQKSLKKSEMLAIKKTFVDQNATFEEIEQTVVDENGNEYPSTFLFSPDEELSRHIYDLQLKEELIENIAELIRRVDGDESIREKIFSGVIKLMTTKHREKILMLRDVVNYLMTYDREFGFMSKNKIFEQLDEIYKSYEK